MSLWAPTWWDFFPTSRPPSGHGPDGAACEGVPPPSYPRSLLRKNQNDMAMSQSSISPTKRTYKFELRLNEQELELLNELSGGVGNRSDYARRQLLGAKPGRRRKTVHVTIPNPRVLWLLEKIRVSLEEWENELRMAVTERSESDLRLLQIEVTHLTQLLESITHASCIHKAVSGLPVGNDRQQEPEKTSTTRSPKR